MADNDDIKVDDSPLSKFRNLRPVMYPVYNDKGEVAGWDYGIDVSSVEAQFPWMVTTDNLGRKTVNKDSLLWFLLACISEQDRDVSVLYEKMNQLSVKTTWDPDEIKS
jgi:hypothetical protein